MAVKPPRRGYVLLNKLQLSQETMWSKIIAMSNKTQLRLVERPVFCIQDDQNMRIKCVYIYICFELPQGSKQTIQFNVSLSETRRFDGNSYLFLLNLPQIGRILHLSFLDKPGGWTQKLTPNPVLEGVWSFNPDQSMQCT